MAEQSGQQLPATRNLHESLSRAEDLATRRKHSIVGLDHLLLALGQDADAVSVLLVCNVDVEALCMDLLRKLGPEARMLSPNTVPPTFDVTVQNLIAHASAAAIHAGQQEIDGSNILSAIISGEGGMITHKILQRHGLTFNETVATLNKKNNSNRPGIAPIPTPPSHEAEKATDQNNIKQNHQPANEESLALNKNIQDDKVLKSVGPDATEDIFEASIVQAEARPEDYGISEEGSEYHPVPPQSPVPPQTLVNKDQVSPDGKPVNSLNKTEHPNNKQPQGLSEKAPAIQSRSGHAAQRPSHFNPQTLHTETLHSQDLRQQAPQNDLAQKGPDAQNAQISGQGIIPHSDDENDPLPSILSKNNQADNQAEIQDKQDSPESLSKKINFTNSAFSPAPFIKPQSGVYPSVQNKGQQKMGTQEERRSEQNRQEPQAQNIVAGAPKAVTGDHAVNTSPLPQTNGLNVGSNVGREQRPHFIPAPHSMPVAKTASFQERSIAESAPEKQGEGKVPFSNIQPPLPHAMPPSLAEQPPRGLPPLVGEPKGIPQLPISNEPINKNQRQAAPQRPLPPQGRIQAQQVPGLPLQQAQQINGKSYSHSDSHLQENLKPHSQAPIEGAQVKQPQPNSNLNVGTSDNQVVENIPKMMRIGKMHYLEVRVARFTNTELDFGSENYGLRSKSLNGSPVTKAITVRLTGPDGQFLIDCATSSTQWSEMHTGMHDDADFAIWRWRVLPRKAGKSKLKLDITVRTSSEDGLTAEIPIQPSKLFNIKVTRNYSSIFKKIASAALLFGLGYGISQYGETAYNWVQTEIENIRTTE